MTLPVWWPRTACVYCAAKLPDVRNGNGCVVPFPSTIACVKCAPLVAVDPEYSEAAPLVAVDPEYSEAAPLVAVDPEYSEAAQ